MKPMKFEPYYSHLPLSFHVWPPTTSSDRLETACQVTGAMLSLAPFGRSRFLLVFSWSPSTATFVQRLSSNT